MKYELPSYEQAVELCEKYPEIFYSREAMDGRLVIFNYRLAGWMDFQVAPYARELRGLTFEMKDGVAIRRFLSVHKFFNYNETEDTSYLALTSKGDAASKMHVQPKTDGSLITPMVLSDNTIVMKSKGSVESEQAKRAQEILALHPEIADFIYEMDLCGVIPQFEYVAPTNQIVIVYAKSELLLIQLRDQRTGQYLNFDAYAGIIPDSVRHDHFENYPCFPFKYKGEVFTDLKQCDFKTLIELMDVLEDIEGVVVTFGDGLMLKMKTNWYRQLHRLVTESLVRANDLVQLYYEERIDDAISLIPPTDVRRKYAEQVVIALRKIQGDLCNKIFSAFSAYDSMPDRKSFAIKQGKEMGELFPIAMMLFNNWWVNEVQTRQELVNKMVIDFIQRKCYRLNEAEKFLEVNTNEIGRYEQEI